MIYCSPVADRGWKFRNRPCKNAHLVADSEKELLTFSKDIGLDPKWIQDDPIKYFDLVPAKRRAAIKAGSVPLTEEQYQMWLAQKIKVKDGAVKAAAKRLSRKKTVTKGKNNGKPT